MKNTGIVILCCILAVAFLPLVNKKDVKILNENYIVSVFNTEKGKIEETSLEEYVLKVLEKEMPPTYELEALKAQAIAIRTYTMRKKDTTVPQHNGAEVCTDYKHCMAYAYDEKELWGDKTEEYIKIYKKAVDETKGIILTYEEKPAATFFFAISGGNTQNCSDVWGSDLPYLKSVNSEVDKTVTGYETKVRFTLNELNKKLGVDFSENFQTEYFPSGYVKSITFDSKTIKGEEIRSLLELRSSCFEIVKEGEEYVFKVYGYGHGVGMSQQGANQMAKQGKTYLEILNHYYNGTVSEKLAV